MARRFRSRPCGHRGVERAQFGNSKTSVSHSTDAIPQFHLVNFGRIQIAQERGVDTATRLGEETICFGFETFSLCWKLDILT
jgi:hypothetical protein